jgi:creatinine amidohydrolase
MLFGEMSAPMLRSVDRDQTLVVAPIASCEQHGDHLPVFTDSILCAAVADALERALPGRVLLLPLLWLGASEHHLSFGGTLTATLPTYETLLVELVTPLLREGFLRVMLLNGHGGNNDPMRVALRRLDDQFPGRLLTGAAYWDLAKSELEAQCSGPLRSVGHACEIETSLMLHLRPDLVAQDRRYDDPADSPGLPEGLYRARDFGRRTRRGPIGFPSRATAESGEAMFRVLVRRVVEAAAQLVTLPLVSEFPV